MKILKPEDVIYIGKLARIKLSPGEIESLSSQLNDILTYINTLNKVDTKDTLPTSHVLSLSNVFRADSVRESLPVDDVLGNAPAKYGDFFRVPKVIEES